MASTSRANAVMLLAACGGEVAHRKRSDDANGRPFGRHRAPWVRECNATMVSTRTTPCINPMLMHEHTRMMLAGDATDHCARRHDMKMAPHVRGERTTD